MIEAFYGVGRSQFQVSINDGEFSLTLDQRQHFFTDHMYAAECFGYVDGGFAGNLFFTCFGIAPAAERVVFIKEKITGSGAVGDGNG